MSRWSALGFIPALMLSLPERGWTQPDFKVTSTVTSAEKGKVFEILLRIATDKRLDALSVTPLAPENFCIRLAPMSHLTGFHAGNDGSSTFTMLAEGSVVTLQYRVATPSQLLSSGSSCPALDSARARTPRLAPHGSTRDTLKFVFNAEYHIAGDSLWRVWSDVVEVRYAMSSTMFLSAGMIGVFVGYLVKTFTARKPEVDEARSAGQTWYGRFGRLLAYLFGTSIDKFLTSLILGFAALLAVAKSGIPIGGAVAAAAMGASLAVLADDALISKVK